MSSYTENLQRLRGAQKPGAGVPAYTRWINRRLARHVAAAAAALHITANGVTAISAVISLAGLITLVIAPVTWWSGLAVAALLAAGYVLDSADGQVARLTGTGGPAGEWLDHVVDAIRTPAIHLAVVVAVWAHTDYPLWLGGIAIAFALIASGQFMSQILAEQLRAKTDRSVASSEGGGVVKSFLILPNDMGSLCWIFVLWGAIPAFAVAYTLLFAANSIHSIVSMRRKFLGLRKP
ncbi:MAG: CDP-alcohol phosphatidyltransferase family protein [Microbacterium sp.]|uniref:CDP-alcohol phosphatidyltransferase family protein n=1 Tax=Microbacterium sp. TaxID=51671 RepID=UPI00272442C3|nr:CDP-alcohol phosphatidyltransferase family protein [Microbacterium sp.]MDO8383768.1 CDP-alcohol phosphatidyltransferase family protein [Microbacterium sp.]